MGNKEEKLRQTKITVLWAVRSLVNLLVLKREGRRKRK